MYNLKIAWLIILAIYYVSRACATQMAEVVQLEVWIPAKTGQNTQYWTDLLESSCWFIPSNHVCLCVSTDHLKLGWLAVNNKIRSAANCNCNRNMNHQRISMDFPLREGIPRSVDSEFQAFQAEVRQLTGVPCHHQRLRFGFPASRVLRPNDATDTLQADFKGCNGGWICCVLPLFGMMKHFV